MSPAPASPPVPSAALIELLARELAERFPRRLLLVPPELAAWAERREAPALGARAAVVAGELGPALAAPRIEDGGGEGEWDAVLALYAGDALPPGELAAGLRGALRPGGRALVVTALATSDGAPPPYEALVAACLENRLLVRKELRSDGSALPWDGARRSGGAGSTILVLEAHAIVVRGYRPGDEVPLTELFRRCFHPERALDHWRWKYRDHPEGEHRISLAADEEGALLAQYAAYPALWWDEAEGRHLRAHQIGDIMSAPEARGRGRGRTSVLAQCARHFYAARCWGRVDFDYGFHTAHSRGFSNRFLAVVDPEPVPFRVLRPEVLEVAGGRGYRVRRLARAGRELDALWRRARGDYGRLVVRDRRRVAWRYFRRPDARYLVLGVFRWRRLAGWSVFRRRGDDLAWVDALFRRRAASAAGLALAAALERLGPVSRVVGWFPPRPEWWHAALTGLGFAEEPEPDDLDLGVVCFSEPTDPERFRRHLYYTMGDSDLV